MFSSDVVISAQNVTKQYGGDVVLNDVNLRVRAGEFVAIVGPSGSGKSTFLHILGCIDSLDNGRLEICGRDATKMSDFEAAKMRNRMIGFVFQFFYFQPHLTVAKNLEIPMMPEHLPRQERAARVQNVASLVGVEAKLQQNPDKLSGGQLQRAAIARAMINQPKIILADEPTGNLDGENSKMVMNLLLNVRQRFGTSLVIVTHDLAIAKMADRALVLENGRLGDAAL